MKRAAVAFAVGAFCLSILPAGCGGGEVDRGNPDIVLILIDGLRYDHLSMNGYHRQTTPVLDSLATSGAVWNRTQAQSSWTLPATASVLTGLSQRSHQAGFTGDSFLGIDPALMTLPLMFQRRGYQTAGLFNVRFLSEDFGFQQGFDHFDCHGLTRKPELRNASRTVDDYLTWYDSDRESERSSFSVVHLFDLHLPYSPPPPWDTLYSDPKADPVFNRFWGSNRNDVYMLGWGGGEIDSAQLDIMVGLYDSELRYTDAQIGRLISELRQRNGLDNTIFVVLGTHGEELMDHGSFGHGHSLYQELLHVPLIISGTGIEPARYSSVAAQYDILPTLLTMIGQELPIWVDGHDLFSLDQLPEARYVTSSNLLWADFDLAAVRLNDRVIAGNPQEMTPVLFDLGQDPGQLNPMTPGREASDQLFYYWSLPPRGDPPTVDLGEHTQEILKHLGYFR
ncbi:MAG: sulfatase-like hydrolase/transferase [Candidatus Aegiribacteria sp.]|nr:sulfatase-like hydrolase/transferase [Candidatus Aegiribacteria sp.]MBD3295200.1 sulfatase-like hydrolase/transferase [Candidatus Fermentibacteria bacterium]